MTLAATMPAASSAITRAARAVLSRETVPQWSRDLESGGAPRTPHSNAVPEPAVAVYFPSCTSTIFGTTDGAGVSNAFHQLCQRVGIRITVPDDIAGLCCGTPWKSKGLDRGQATMRERVSAALTEASENGALPIIVDASSCTEGLRSAMFGQAGMHVLDVVEFVDRAVLPRLTVTNRTPMLALHPTCSSARLGLDAALTRIAAACAERVVGPDSWGCCAFAGDRGLLHPELTASATLAEAREVARAGATAYASLNRTCEVGMTRATGQPYRHILEILLEASQP